ncbi:MAG TPA: protein-L-isoaspartate(D-aspartate) O-methyltransferase [Pirellulales bacterium]|nr:protein-L-isoaspartate(D-aspartate) O-methyltransferase [Pirellulales bacterium]
MRRRTMVFDGGRAGDLFCGAGEAADAARRRAPLGALGLLGLGLLGLFLPGARAEAADRYAAIRREMVDEVVAGAGVKNPRVLESMRSVPRHEFVPADQRRQAYFDMALPIGEGQTISPPFVVASMTEYLDPQPTDTVLEIGTGSGYQSAVLSGLVKDVYSIEIQRPLGERAAETLKRLGYANVHAKIGDGYKGWPEHAPFDKIIVTCSPEKIPQPLQDQLRDGGRMIVPVGERFNQVLYLFKKVDGKLEKEAIEGTMFVPMTGTAESLREIEYDATKPALLNGGFEESTVIAGSPDGWYYFRQGALEKSSEAPEGNVYVKFTNSTPGRFAQVLQAFGADGGKVQELDVKLSVRARDVRPNPRNPAKQKPILAVIFYDPSRAEVGESILGPWTGTFDWTEKKGRIAVPKKARMAVLYLGMHGATGEISFDNVDVRPVTP